MTFFARYDFDRDQRDSETMKSLFMPVIIGLCKVALSFLKEALHTQCSDYMYQKVHVICKQEVN